MPNVLLFIGREGHRYFVDSDVNQELESIELELAQIQRLSEMPRKQRRNLLLCRESRYVDSIKRMSRFLWELGRELSSESWD